MRKHRRYPLIVAVALLLSTLLIPVISATRNGIKQTGIDSSAWDHNPVRVGRFLLASLLEGEDGGPFADLIVTKSASAERVSVGTNVTYTIEVRNIGPDVADNTELKDILPTGMTFVSVTEPAGWTCSTPAVGSGGTVTCTNPSLSATSDDTFTLVVNVPAQTEPGTFFTNTAKVSTTTPDPNAENNSYTAGVMVASGSVNVGVTKSASSDQVNAGDNLTYTIEVRNSGPDAADSVTLNDTLPGNTTFVSVTEPAGWTCSTPAVGSGGTLTCTNPSLSAGSDDTFTLVVNVPSDASLGTVYTNTAKVSTTTKDFNPEDDTSATSTEIASADVSVTKVDTPDPVIAGNNLTYTITVNNAGPSKPDVSLSDTLPANTTFVSIATPDDWSCIKPAVGAGGTVFCSTSSLDKGNAIFTLTVATSPALTAGTIVSNTATVSSGTPDPNPNNQSATATTTVLSPATLSATKTVSGQLTPGSSVTYTVVITNAGPRTQGDNPGNEFTDVLPSSLTLVSASASSGAATANVGTNTVGWNGSLPNGNSATITIQATIKAGTTGTTISNQGSIGYDADGNGTNESSTQTDDPAVAGSNNPTSFVVNAVPTISINDVSVTEGNGGTVDAVFTVTLSASSSLTTKVDYQTANDTASSGSDYQPTSGTLTFNPGETTKTITVPVNGDTVNEADETFLVNLSNPQNATLADGQGIGKILNDDTPRLQLSSNNYDVGEGAGHVTITVNRTGDISEAASVQFATSDLAGLNNCDVNTGNASARCDYTAVGGTLNFEAGEATRTFTVPIINDVYVEGTETLTLTLSNAVGSVPGTPSTATLTITDDDTTPGASNPIDQREFLVRQLYLDALNREPEPSGLADWLDRLNTCPRPGETPQNCDEIQVASDFFRSAEFFDRAYFIYRFYEVGLGRKPDYDEYQRDLRLVSGFLTDAELEARKQQFAQDFSQRADFRARYDQYDSATRSQEYVDALSTTAGVTLPNRTQLANDLASNTKQRWDVLRAIVESQEVSTKFYNKAFVVIGYFAFLRRDPDAQYLLWLQKLDTTGDYREMVRGFMQSQEYRSRFGPS